MGDVAEAEWGADAGVGPVMEPVDGQVVGQVVDRAAERRPPVSELDRLRDENATLTRILGAIEEYVYSGEFLVDGSYLLRFAGPCRERFLGLSVEQARHARWVDYIHPDEVARFDRAHEVAKASGVLDVQYRLCGADGQTRWVRTRGRVRQVGDRFLLDGSVLDVTASRETQERLTEHVRDIEVLATAHRELALSSDPAAARRAVCRAVRIVCGARGVGLYQPVGSELVLVGADGVIPCSRAMSTDGRAGTVAAYRSGQRGFVPEASALRAAQPLLAEADVASVLFEPVLSGGRTIGVITVVWADPVEALPARVEALLPLLVAEVEVALERAALVDRLSVEALTDVLTGLPNRRALDGLLKRELERAGRAGTPLCLAVVDLDHFKAYNDSCGHPAGDALLQEAALSWRSALRSADALVRVGGEEFLVVLPGCDLPEAVARLEALRRTTPQGQTCSVGVTCWDGSESATALLQRADQTMYLAKRAGRDRVVA